MVDKQRERLGEFLPWPPKIQSPSDQREWLAECEIAWAELKQFPFIIFEEQQIIGTIEAFDLNWNHHSCEIGYWINIDHEGKGLMTEAVQILQQELFDLGFNRIMIRCNPKNLRSSAIPKRLGYHYEGTLRQVHFESGQYKDLEVYSKLQTELPVNRQP